MIDFYTASTPNGFKVAIMLHELGVEFKEHRIDLSKGQQKEPAFIAMNPNGRIPVIVDQDNSQAVFESGAILYYLAEKYGKFFGKDLSEKSHAMEWLMFQMSGIGPNFGNLYFGKNSLKPENPAYIERFQKESARLIGVMEIQLQKTAYLAGSEYTIADMATYPWLQAIQKTAPELLSATPAVSRWMQLVAQRPAVQKVLA